MTDLADMAKQILTSPLEAVATDDYRRVAEAVDVMPGAIPWEVIDHGDGSYSYAKSDLTATRGADYGPPWEHHAKTAILIDILLDGKAPMTAIQWQACMVLDKLVRLSHSWTHLDSAKDVRGYGECMEVTLERGHE